MAKGSAIAQRGMARLVAVQLLYRQAMEPIAAKDLLEEYKANPDMLDHEEELVTPDAGLLGTLVMGVSDKRGMIDEMLNARITKEQASEPIIASILRCGIFELLFNTQTPVAVIISDYLNVAAAFFEGRETALINGVLDKVAKLARPE